MRLLDYLFERQGYNPLVRPVANMSDTVRVQLGMALIQLIDVVSLHSARLPIREQAASRGQILHGENYLL